MATVKISELTSYTTPDNTDVVPVVDTTNSTTKKITWANIKATLKTYFDTLYEVPITFSTGLTRSTNTVTVNTSQNISTLSNLTSNGFVKTSGGTGALSVDTTTYLTASSTDTLTNKRITKRVGTTTSSASLTIDSDSYDLYTVTALAEAMTINSPSGTPTSGQPLLIRIKDNATGRALTWNSVFRVVGTTLPSTTVASKYNYIGCVWNSTDSKWDVITSLQEV